MSHSRQVYRISAPPDVRAGRQGFTLLELLVVIAILGVLIGLLASAMQQVRNSAYRAECSNHLRQIGLALQNYHGAHGVFPPGVSYREGRDPYPFLSWSARVLPFLDQQGLWNQTERAFAQDRRFTHNPPHSGLSTVLSVYNCPADNRKLSALGNGSFIVVHLSYLGIEGTNQYREDGILFLDSRVRLSDITDGTSNTLLVGERPPSADGVFGWWYAGEGQNKDGSGDMVLGVRERNANGPYTQGCSPVPYEFGPGEMTNQCDLFHFWSLHVGGAHFVFADGSVRFLRYSAAPLMPALATRAGGEVVSLPDRFDS